MTRVGVVHTVSGLVPVFETLLKQHLPGIAHFNVVDESLLKNTIRDGRLTPETRRRVLTLLWSTFDAGADTILVTCSSIGAAVDDAQAFCEKPVFRVDEGMANEAINLGTRIGVLATLATTLDPTRALIERHAARRGKAVTIDARICAGAFDALQRGDLAGHDEAVESELRRLAANVDVVVLAQASMARVAGLVPAGVLNARVLSSPELGVRHFKARLAETPR